MWYVREIQTYISIIIINIITEWGEREIKTQMDIQGSQEGLSQWR